jgi:hypothetical protein
LDDPNVSNRVVSKLTTDRSDIQQYLYDFGIEPCSVSILKGLCFEMDMSTHLMPDMADFTFGNDQQLTRETPIPDIGGEWRLKAEQLIITFVTRLATPKAAPK